jgi:alpha-beta hydrolase superfamily lysophospholipase
MTASAGSPAKHAEGFLQSKDGLRLYWQAWTPPGARAMVAVLHGYADHSGRYGYLVDRLVASGLSVAALDFRGHGKSEGRRGHIGAFDEYLGDLDAFLAEVKKTTPGGQKLFIVSHSHGGLITARWAMERPKEASSEVAGVVFSAPYFKLAMKPPALKILSAKLVGTIIPFLPVPTGIAYADISSDVEWQKKTEADVLYNKNATPRWFNESNRVQEEVLRRASEFVTPMLMVSPGADPIADARAARAFFDAATAKDKEFKTYDGFRHESFNEVERDRPLGDVAAWIAARI